MKTIQDKIFTAVNSNSTLMLTSLLSQFVGKLDMSWLNRAAKRNFIDIVKILRERGCEWDASFTAIAALHGSYECLVYAYNNGCPWDSSCTTSAAKNDSLACLSFAHKNGCPIDDLECCAMAAGSGSLECLAYLYTNGCKWDAQTCTEAAANDEMECLRYAHESGCPWDCTTTANAFSAEILSYLHTNSCPWDESTILNAIDTKNWECFEYALQNGCPISLESAYRSSEEDDRMFEMVLDCLWKISDSDSQDLTWFLASKGDDHNLKHVLRLGCPLHPEAAVAAATNDHFETWMYLWENCTNPQTFVDQDYHGTLSKFIHRINPKYDVWSKLLQVDCSANQELEQFIRQYKRDQWDY